MVLSRRADGEPLEIIVDAPEPLAELPAAVEVAAYRIATEALTNVTLHSSASTATIRLYIAGSGLHVSVHDGVNVGDGWQPGVGLTSIRERAAELGGLMQHPARPYRRPRRRVLATGEERYPGGRSEGSGGTEMTLRIVVADDHAFVREGLRALVGVRRHAGRRLGVRPQRCIAAEHDPGDRRGRQRGSDLRHRRRPPGAGLPDRAARREDPRSPS
jgi:hypothetical protein